jgi:hypothetical protein
MWAVSAIAGLLPEVVDLFFGTAPSVGVGWRAGGFIVGALALGIADRQMNRWRRVPQP